MLLPLLLPMLLLQALLALCLRTKARTQLHRLAALIRSCFALLSDSCGVEQRNGTVMIMKISAALLGVTKILGHT